MAVSLIVAAPQAGFGRHSPPQPLSPFNRAQRLRLSLESIPAGRRTRGDYERVLNSFRAVYHEDPASPKADVSIDAVAGLLAEEGRILGDRKSLRDAVGQYEFLRQQYPGSRYRFSALIAEGEIYRWEIGDRGQAKAIFQDFVRAYPENPLAGQARSELQGIRDEEAAEKRRGRARMDAAGGAASEQGSGSATVRSTARMGGRGRNSVLAAAVRSREQPPPALARSGVAASSRSGSQTGARLSRPISASQPEAGSQGEETEAAELPAEPDASFPRRPASLVTGIRHWSTPVYTRIAIDLQSQVAYEAGRVPHPDRIYFDLHGARLARALEGESVPVTDDGFLKRIRAAQFSNDVTRIVLDVSSVADYSAFLLPNPWRLIIDIHGRKAGAPVAATEMAVVPPQAPSSQAGTSQQPAASAGLGWRHDRGSVDEIADLNQQSDRVQATQHPTSGPIAASVAGATPAPQADDGSLAAQAAAPPVRSRSHPVRSARSAPSSSEIPGGAGTPAAREADPTASGELSLVRTLGLKIGRIVVDPGHGGHDSGTLGPGGLEEKQVVLDVALRLGKLLKQRLGADVIFTRKDDTFIPLETRTAIANKVQADLFLSIHANSSPDPAARGVETYYLNFTTSPDALEVAARENAVSGQSIHELSDLVKKITLRDKIEESREFAADVQRALYGDLEEGNPGLKDRGVKQAPFVVLIGANMPSILAEISFLTNPEDAQELNTPAYRERIAESLYRGVAKYIGGLSGVRLAENPSRSSAKLASSQSP